MADAATALDKKSDAVHQKKLTAARKRLKRFQKEVTKGGTSKPIPTASSVNKSLPDLPHQSDFNENNYQVDSESVEKQSATGIEIVTNENKFTSISSSENLRQISLQLNGLMSETNDLLNGEIDGESTNLSELEKRNLELAALVEKHQQTNEQLTNQLQELKNQNNKLRQSLQQQQDDIEERHFKEQGSLKEQLQVHIQTIGILVAEKTELQASLSQSQQTAKQKAAEVEELQGRLKASRQRMTDLEKGLNATQTSSQQFEKTSKENSKEVDRLKIEIYKTNKRMEELQQENSELSEKLNSRITDSQKLRDEIEETKNLLSMAELRLQQLSGSDDTKNLIEDLSVEKIQLEKKIAQMKESLLKLSQERDSMAEQYQQFSQQLNEQIKNLSQQITNLAAEKAALANEKIQLSNRINSLEEQFDQVNKQSSTIPLISEEIDRLTAMLHLAEEEKIRLLEQHEKDISDNAQLSRMTEELSRQVEGLESDLESKKEEEVGRQQLLEQIESDKVATSRAMAQNRELKKQLEELQNGFIVMSNNKLELVEKLESEQHVAKELGERLTQQEEELKELREQLAQKERDLNSQNNSEMKQMYQQQQLLDRMRHYEAQGQLTELLQRELTQAQERLSVLTSQNSELRTLLAQQGQQLLSTNKNGEERETTRKDDMVASLSASVNQLEMERDALMRQLDQQQGQREVYRAQLKEMKESENGETVSHSEYERLKDVLHQLEERFTKTMREIAELSDQKQQLEHLVTQLQGETDTIGEYIALYQVQRGIMKQRAMEKDEYIAQLARDRENMKTKLTQLQDLVMRLLYERESYTTNGNADIIRPPGKAIPSLGSKIDLSALNGAETLPEWPDLEKDFGETTVNDKSKSKSVKAEEPEENDTTAKKIMDLITEIGSSSLIEKPTLDNFHPCPVCSGKLMTV